MERIIDILKNNLLNNIELETLVLVLITLIVGIFLINVIRVLITKLILKRSNKQNKMLINKLISYSGYSLLLLIILGELGIELSTILGAAGVFGIALGIASQKSLGNIISGFFLVTEKSFEIGDVIKVGDKAGTVYSVELLSIMLKTFDNKLIRIPNEFLISTEITNITKFPIRRLDVDIQVAYKEDLTKIISVLENIAIENPLFLDEPKSYMQIKDFGQSGINIVFGVWFEKENFIQVKNSLMIDIVERFRIENIEIPYPHIVYKGITDAK